MTIVQEQLKQEYPEATDAEVCRFGNACRGPKKGDEVVIEEAGAMLEEYLDWRSCYGLDYTHDSDAERTDASDWKFALDKVVGIQKSLRVAKELEEKLADEAKEAGDESNKVDYDADITDTLNENGESENEKEDGGSAASASQDETSQEKEQRQLSQCVFFHRTKDGIPLEDKKGCKIIHCLSALIDRKVAQAPFYSDAISFYLDRVMDRKSDEKYTILVDFRAGEGWPNTAAVMMVKFVHTLAGVLQRRFPERVDTLILFPMPWGTSSIWGAVKRVFRSDVLDNVILISGPAGTSSPLPKEPLSEQIDESYLDQIETVRLEKFKLAKADETTNDA